MLQGMRARFAWVLLAVSFPAAQAADAPLLARIFDDHVVLQRDRPINVYGRANAGDAVTVTLSGASQRATAGADGRWRVALPAQPAGGPFTLTAQTASRTQTVNDVLLSPFSQLVSGSKSNWVTHGVPAGLALLVYGFGLGFLANLMPAAKTHSGGDWRTAS